MMGNGPVLLKLLADKHAKDVFVAECKDGPTWTNNHLRLDAWVMARSWSHPLVTGYELKVSRSDFLADSKWQHYLPLCNVLYFVALKGIINPNELAPEVGLIEATTNAGRLLIRKKAAWRDVKVPEELYRYILMSRVRVVNAGQADGLKGKEYWRAWLADKDEKKELGYRVARAVREHVTRVEQENKLLRDQNRQFEIIKKMCADLGINPAREWDLRGRLADAISMAPPELLDQTKRLIQELAKFGAALGMKSEGLGV